MHLTWELIGNWFDREYAIADSEGEIVEKLGENPSLIQLRSAEKKYQERIDLWQSGLLCSNCGNEINGRFGADPQGELLCWNCTISAKQENENGLIVNTDTTEAALSESKLHTKGLCDYVINVATGCRHGCRFCYVPTTPGVENREETLKDRADVEDVQSDWGNYLLYRDDLPERLRTQLTTKNSWKRTKRGRGIVMLSSGTDCYQDRRTAQITRSCVSELIKHNKRIRILTRSPAVTRDIDLLKEGDDLVIVGSSIPSLDDDLVKSIEPQAPPPTARWEALDELRKEGVPRFVSMSPTYPTMGSNELWNLLTHLRALDPEIVYHEPVNPRGANFSMCVNAAKEDGRDALAKELEKLTNRENWIEYALKQIDLVQTLAEEISGLNVHSWPDRELIKATDGDVRIKLSEMRDSVPNEHFEGEKTDSSQSQSPLVEDNSTIRQHIR